jgi:hypothetical protein
MSSKYLNFLNKKPLLSALAVLVLFTALSRILFPSGSKSPLPVQPDAAMAASDADFNHDGEVTIEDLQLFSLKVFGLNWEDVDWCLWAEQQGDEAKEADELFDFIRDFLGCDVIPPEPNEPPTPPVYPTRLTWGPEGRLYVCDDRAGSIIIYEVEQSNDFADPNLPIPITPVKELKGLDRPLGIAVDSSGNIYVGSNGRDCVEVYNQAGEKTKVIDPGYLKMPNDIVFDDDGNLYVVDSIANTIVVYDPEGNRIRLITDGLMDFPTTITIGYVDDGLGNFSGELYVGDMGNFKIKVFDLEGNYLRSFGGKKGSWGGWEGKFVKIQSLALDDFGQLHVADCYMNRVQILNPITGGYLGFYGELGSLPGQMRVPLDIEVNSVGQVAVANYGNKCVEVIKPTP